MPTTAALIDQLAAGAAPVRRLRRPAWRTLGWLAIAAALIAAITAVSGIRPGLMDAFRDPLFALGRAGALATALAGALATFELSLPDRSPRWLALPLPFAALWLGTMGYGCIADWIAVGPAGLQLGHSGECFKVIVMTSLPLAAVLFVMVRHAGPVRPIPTALAGGLTLAAVAEGGMTLYHDVDATLMDLLAHLAAVAVVIALSTAGARTVFRLLGPISGRRRAEIG
jgi:hypothetical protein